MSFTTTLASTPTKLKRTGSILLSPSKRNRADKKQEDEEKKRTPPTHKEIFSWALTQDAVASCHIRDVHSLQEKTILGGPEPTQVNKHAGPDFFWLGRVPCRNVRIVGLVVGVSQYDERTSYIVDDGTAVIECSHRVQPVKRVSEPGKTPLAPESLLPSASVGDTVRIIGAASKKYNEWQIKVDRIECCSSRNDEPRHYLNVSKLHSTHYSLLEPFTIPASTKTEQQRVPSTPSRTIAPAEPSSRTSNYTAQSSPVTIIASSPIKGVPSTPTKLRHPSRLHHVELTRNTFRIYLKYFMDTGPSDKVDDNDNNDPFAPSFAAEDPSTPTKYGAATPKPTLRFSMTMARPKIDPLSFGHLTGVTTATPSSSSPSNPIDNMRGYTMSYLRRVPELALLANRVAKQEARLARKQEKEKERKKTSSSIKSTTAPSAAATASSSSSQARLPTPKDIKRLFVRATNELYREGSIVIWDCPSYPCNSAATSPGDTSFLWKTMSSTVNQSIMSSSSSTTANSTANYSVAATATTSSAFSNHSKTGVAAATLEGGDDGDEGELSDPDPNEDVYLAVTREFLASRLEEVIPVVQDLEKKKRRVQGQGQGGRRGDGPPAQAYRGASSEGLLQYLKRDDRWTCVHIDSVEDALRYLEEEGRAWTSALGWQLTV